MQDRLCWLLQQISGEYLVIAPLSDTDISGFNSGSSICGAVSKKLAFSQWKCIETCVNWHLSLCSID